MKRTLLVTTVLALLLGCHAADNHTAATASTQYNAAATASTHYAATFHVVEEQTIAPGGGAVLALPTANTWGFDSWIFFEVTIPTFEAGDVELEPGQYYGSRVPVLTFTPNEGWELIEENEGDGMWKTVWFYSETVASGAGFMPLFDQWTMPNFRVRSGRCGSHTYDDLIAAANEAKVKRYSLQADGINGSPETLWSMVR